MRWWRRKVTGSDGARVASALPCRCGWAGARARSPRRAAVVTIRAARSLVSTRWAAEGSAARRGATRRDFLTPPNTEWTVRATAFLMAAYSENPYEQNYATGGGQSRGGFLGGDSSQDGAGRVRRADALMPAERDQLAATRYSAPGAQCRAAALGRSIHL